MIADWNLGGIYKITNEVTGKTYVGRALVFLKRYYSHRQALRKGNHINKELQNDFNIYGEHSFKFEILKVLNEKNNSREIERAYINEYFEKGVYNVSDPMSEWNPSLDKNYQTLYQNLEKEAGEKMESYKSFKIDIKNEFEQTFKSIESLLKNKESVIEANSLLEEFKKRVSANSDFYFLLPLVIKDILDEKGVLTIYTSKHIRAFSKTGINLEKDSYVHLHSSIYQKVYATKEKSTEKEDYLNILNEKISSCKSDIESKIKEEIENVNFISFNKILENLININVIYRDDINDPQKIEVIKKCLRNCFNIGIIKWRSYPSILESEGIITEKINEDDTWIIITREKSKAISEKYNKK